MQLGNMQWGTLEYIFAIFAIATAVGVLLQAGIMLGFFIAFLKLQGKIATILTQITDHAMPLIASSKVTLEELSPKVQTISTNLVEISELLKQETRAQTARVDEMVSGTLDGISQASTTIQQGIEIPLRHVHGIFNGLKAAFQTYKDQPTRPVSPFAEVEEPVVVVVEEVIVAKANT
jgi:hypothetical protein